MNKLYKKIKDLRESLNISPKELADKSGLSPAYISKLENGEYKSLSLKTSKQLANGLGITLKDFLEKVGLIDDNAENVNPSLQLINNALRVNGFSNKQVAKIIEYAEFIKNTEQSK